MMKFWLDTKQQFFSVGAFHVVRVFAVTIGKLRSKKLSSWQLLSRPLSRKLVVWPNRTTFGFAHSYYWDFRKKARVVGNKSTAAIEKKSMYLVVIRRSIWFCTVYRKKVYLRLRNYIFAVVFSVLNDWAHARTFTTYEIFSHKHHRLKNFEKLHTRILL